ncbi:MAG: N-formylglutamate amidohydrolase [Kordiimonadaceae bacterium]|nr:N-formylglutamate amidohydrolase [Kordiimonadaceae bacterium]
MKLYSLRKAKTKTNNIIYNSPHSGECFPDGFLNSTLIDEHTLLCSGDSFVDQLYTEAQKCGSVLLSNNFARSFMDTNREAYELDPEMFNDEITEKLNNHSQKVKLGFGSIAKYAYTRKDIYKTKLPFDQAKQRLLDYYFPIHDCLNTLLNEEYDRFGYSLLIDCHSMPSYEFLGQKSLSHNQSDIILGNLYGSSCHSAITDYITRHFKKYDLTVSHNAPFAGGYNTTCYGAPDKGRHAIQIEINKSLYMDESARKLNKYFDHLKVIISELMFHLDQDIDALINDTD